MTIRLLIADDHELVREGLHAIFAHSGIEVAGEATTCQEAIQLATALEADVLLLDISMPGGDGFEVLQRVRAETSLPVIIYSMHDREHHFRRARELGASGYVTKRARRDELVRAIESASRGEAHWEESSEGSTRSKTSSQERHAPSRCRGSIF